MVNTLKEDHFMILSYIFLIIAINWQNVIKILHNMWYIYQLLTKSNILFIFFVVKNNNHSDTFSVDASITICYRWCDFQKIFF
jgi:hypothetical protein